MVAYLDCPGPRSFITNSCTNPQQNRCKGADIILCRCCYANLIRPPEETHGQCENPLCNCCCKKAASSPIVEATCCGCCQNQLVGENNHAPAEYCRCPWCTEGIKVCVANDRNEVHSDYLQERPQCENLSCNCCFRKPRYNPPRNCESCHIQSGKNYLPFEYYCCPWCSGGILINRNQGTGDRKTNCPGNNENRIIRCPYFSGEPNDTRTNTNNIPLAENVKKSEMNCRCCKRCENEEALPTQTQCETVNQNIPVNVPCKPTRSVIIVGGKLIINGPCARRNGLQDECGCDCNI